MRKHLFLSVMLGLCAFSSMTVYPTPAMATVTQSPTIKVRGQIVDEQGEPMPGATVRVKADKAEPLPTWMETSSWKFPETLSF